MNGRHRQSGQVLVIFAGGLLTLMVIAALVIDLGFTMTIRRAEQDAADAGAIAAARFIRTGAGGTAEPTKMREAACFYAEQNGFFPSAGGNIDGCVPANDPSGTVLTVNYPPSAGGGSFVGTDGYVEVGLTRIHRSFLAGIVGLGNLRVSTSAVAAFTVGQSNSSSLIALDPGNSCQAGKTHGTGNINIHPVVAGTDGGYVHVNSTCSTGSPDGTCSTNGQGALDIVGGGTVTAPHTYVAGTCKESGNLNSVLTEGAVQIGDPLAELPMPPIGTPNPGAECGIGSGTFTTPTGSGSGGCRFSPGTITLAPGVYYGGWDIRNNVTLVLQPGIYFIAGGGITLNAGGSITDAQGASGTPAPVLIVNTDNPVTHTGQSNVDFTATSTLKLHALDSGPYKGILVWNDRSGSNPSASVTLGGQTTFDIAGTIYDPKGLVTLEGGSGVGSTASVQVIAWQFDVGGNATLDMPYDPTQLYQFPAKGLVH
jgi:putative Flp pilus-assembly TadE/G-like protein